MPTSVTFNTREMLPMGTNAYEQSNAAGGPKVELARENQPDVVVARKPCDLRSALKSRWHGSRKGGRIAVARVSHQSEGSSCGEQLRPSQW